MHNAVGWLLRGGILTGAAVALAAPPVKLWDVRFGGSGTDIAQIVRETVLGYVVAGGTWSPGDGDQSEGTRGEMDFWVLLLAPGGERMWDHRFGGSGYDEACDIQPTYDGDYIAAGFSSSGMDGDKTGHSRGGMDYWIVNIDSFGGKNWDTCLGGSGNDVARAILPTYDGGYVVAGFSSSPADNDKSEDCRGGTDFWIVKIDSNGAKVWDRRYGGYFDEEANAIQATPDGGFIVVGSSDSWADYDKSEDTRGGTDFWVVKLDAAGAKQWDRRFGGASEDTAYAVQVTADGGYLVAGNSYSGVGGDKSQPSRGAYDMWVVKLNAAGAKQWDRRFGGANYDEARSIAAHADGGYVVAGVSNSEVDGDKSQPSRGNMDYWIVKINAAGAKQWDRRFGGNRDDTGYAIHQTLDDGWIMAGSSDSSASGDRTQDTRGWEDYWVVKLMPGPDEPTGVTASDGAYRDRIRVTWNGAANALSYEVWRNTDIWSHLAVRVGTTTVPEFEDRAVSAGVMCYYWVKTLTAVGASSLSQPDSGYRGVVGPLVRANRQIGDQVVIRVGDPVTVEAEMMNLPAGALGLEADWWVAALAHDSGAWYYLNGAMAFTPFDGTLAGIRPAHQGPLLNLGPRALVRQAVLAPGAYSVWFAVDYPMDGVLRLTPGRFLMSRVTLAVQYPN